MKSVWLYQEEWQAKEAFDCLLELLDWASENDGGGVPVWDEAQRLVRQQEAREGKR